MAKLIDRKDKMEPAAFTMQVDALCTSYQREQGVVEVLLQILSAKKLEQLPEALQALPVVQGLRGLLDGLQEAGITNARFDPALMRGFDYYTGVVFEVFDTNPENNRSMFGGGRYDGLVGLFGVEPVPTIGFGMGDVTLQNFLESHELLPKLLTETDLYIVLIGDVTDKAQRTIRELRENGLRVAVDISGRKPDKQIRTAEKKGIHYVLFIGERELEQEQFVLRNIVTSEEERHGISRVTSIVKDYRKNR
jgi:histidyl-tRNA synthetase